MLFRLALGAFAALSLVSPAGASPPVERPPQVVTFDHSHQPLFNSRIETIVGRWSGDGSCVFQPPALDLGPEQQAISMRQNSIDYTRCTSTVEIGFPVLQPVTGATRGTDDTEPASETKRFAASRRPSAGARAAATSSGYYEIRWEDAAHIDVNKTRARLTWTWNGTCVTSGSGSGYWWWRSETGWHLDDNGSNAWLQTGCSSYYTHANGHFWNSSFCFPLPITDVYVNDDRFRGGYAGGYGGNLGSTHVDDDCFPLHWHADLVKTS